MVNKQFIAQNRPAEKPAADMSVSLSGLRLDNPVVPASGTFGYGNEFRDFYDINILGSFSFKGTTRDARFGWTMLPIITPTRRIIEFSGFWHCWNRRCWWCLRFLRVSL